MSARIDDYSFGRVQIDGTTYTSDVIIYPDRVDHAWWRTEGHSLCLDDLAEVLGAKPEVLVVGTGAQGIMRVPDDVRRALSDLGIELHVARTGDACGVYNRLSALKTTVAALHLTC